MEPARALIRPVEAPAPQPTVDRRVAVIDVGSNTARLVLFRASREASIRAIFEEKESPRLGLNVGPDGSLDRTAVERGSATLQRFAATLQALGRPPTVAVATSAVRDAPNGAAFLDRVARETGIGLRVLTGTDEARSAYLGIASAWELHDELVADLGGGSLQIAAVRSGHLANSVSLPLGGLRLTGRFLEHDPPKGREIDALRERVRGEIDRSLDALGRRPGRLFGVGGTVRSLAKLAINLRDFPIARVHGYPLRPRDLAALSELVIDMPAERRAELPGIGNDRADVIVAGLVVIEELLKASKSEIVTVSGTGIREGLALELLGADLPASAEELARRSVRAASGAFDFSTEHGERVERAARQLFELLAKRREWSEEEHRALSVAAWMHDSGTAIDIWRHARHSAYLIRNVPLWGLSQREVLLASMAAYLHEGDASPSSWRKDYLPIVNGADIQTARGLGTILYVAESLDGSEPRFAMSEGSSALTIARGRLPEDGGPPAKAAEKVRKPLAREFGLEVRLRDP